MALRIIFMGTPDFAVPILSSIFNSQAQNYCKFILKIQKK